MKPKTAPENSLASVGHPAPAMQRDTPQRRAIRQTLSDAARPLSPVEILESARATAPKLSLATVYRTVNGLVAEGWLSIVELPGEYQRYERAGKGHHHHFHCRSCDGVFDLQGCPDNIGRMLPSGFTMESHEVILYGVCKGCKRG